MNFPFWKADEALLLDGAMGTMLQQRGMKPGVQPELLNLSDPDLIASVHRDYLEAGSRVLYANTLRRSAFTAP